MRVNPFVFGALVLVFFLGAILSAQASGNWSVSGKVTSTGQKVVASGTNPDEIKGWMTLGEVAAAYGLSIGEVLKEFDLPADTDPAKQIKELESEKFSTTNLRNWLKGQMGGGGS